MIQDKEFWGAVTSSAPNGPLALSILAVDLHKSYAVGARRRPVVVQVVASPQARTPLSALANTPNGGAAISAGAQMASLRSPDASGAGAQSPSLISPSSSMHEPFLEPSGTAASPGGVRLRSSKSAASGGGGGGGGVLCKSSSAKLRAPVPFELSTLPVREGVVRLLQHVLLFVAPLYTLRYVTPAMSMSWNSACVIDAATQRLITFGAAAANVPVHLKCKGCVAGDSFIAVLTEKEEVWVSGSLDCGNGSITSESSDNMRGIAAKTLMISGRGSRLLALTRSLSVRPLSIVPVNTRTMLPSRLIRFVEVGFGDDCYMVGVDSIIYKTTITQRNVTTPRRVMTLARIPVSRVASGASFHLILDEMGQLYTVGKNKKGQLGNGLKQDSMRRPYRIQSLHKHFLVQAAAGEAHSLVLATGGEVYGCGSNENGQLGLGEGVMEVLRMTRIPLPGKCAGIAAGPLGSMFALADGRLFTCGSNDAQQLGLGPASATQVNVFTPTMVPKNIVSAVALAAVDFFNSPRNDGTPSPAADTALMTASAAASRGNLLPSEATAGSRSSAALAASSDKTVSQCCKCCSVM